MTACRCDKRPMANHEVFVMIQDHIAAKEAEGCVADPSVTRWNDSLASSGHDRPVAAMLHALAGVGDLSQPEKMNLLNLPVVTTSEKDPVKATLCDVCLAVPRIREGFTKEQVGLIAQIVFKHKRFAS